MYHPIRVLGIRNAWRQPQSSDLRPYPGTCPRPALNCGTQVYLALAGAAPDVLRPARRLLIFASVVTLALNVAEP
jgi:hypothetical protein